MYILEIPLGQNTIESMRDEAESTQVNPQTPRPQPPIHHELNIVIANMDDTHVFHDVFNEMFRGTF